LCCLTTPPAKEEPRCLSPDDLPILKAGFFGQKTSLNGIDPNRSRSAFGRGGPGHLTGAKKCGLDPVGRCGPLVFDPVLQRKHALGTVSHAWGAASSTGRGLLLARLPFGDGRLPIFAQRPVYTHGQRSAGPDHPTPECLLARRTISPLLIDGLRVSMPDTTAPSKKVSAKPGHRPKTARGRGSPVAKILAVFIPLPGVQECC